MLQCIVEQLHIKHYKTLLQLAQYRLRTLTGSTSEAEDVVQDVFLLAAEKDIYRLDDPLRWLMKTTSYMCLKRMDRAIREREKGQRLIRDKLDNSTDRSANAVDREESETEARELLMAVEQVLPPEDWKIMQAYCLEGVPIEEISKQMGIPINTLRVRIFRIRKKLDKYFLDMKF